jgi:hypothetical protein
MEEERLFKVSIVVIRCRGGGRSQTVLLLALRRREGRHVFLLAAAFRCLRHGGGL